jgi:hypothetical protein
VTDTLTAATPPPEPEGEPASGSRKAVVLGVAALVALVGGFLLVRWLRRGGAERVARELAAPEAIAIAHPVVEHLY